MYSVKKSFVSIALAAMALLLVFLLVAGLNRPAYSGDLPPATPHYELIRGNDSTVYLLDTQNGKVWKGKEKGANDVKWSNVNPPFWTRTL